MVRECGRAWSLRREKVVRELESREPAAASSGARRRAKVRQSGEVDPGGEGCAAENSEGGDFS